MNRMVRTGGAVLAVLLLSAVPASARAADAAAARDVVERAAGTFTSFLEDKQYTAFHAHLKKAKALVIFPRVIRAGFFWGGSGGHGVLVVRDAGSGAWSQPAFYSMGSVSYGLQIGAEEAEVVMMAMSAKAVDSLYASSFKFGGVVSIAAGPHGVGAKKVLNADFVSFAKAKGLYAGLNFEGSGVQVRDDLNRAYYGRDVRPIEIVKDRAVSNPSSAKLLSALQKAP